MKQRLGGVLAVALGAVLITSGIHGGSAGVIGAPPADCGEITGTAIETLMACTLRFSVIKNTVIAFSHRHDKHWFKHYLVPVIGALMNLAMLCAVVYLAVKAGGQGASDAYKALGTVGVWIVLGAIWFMVNPGTKGKKMLDPNAPKREQVLTTG